MASWWRVILVPVLIVALLCSVAGVAVTPVRVSSADVAGGEWFPCKGHGCGCVSAEMCRTRCCCHKPSGPPKPPQLSSRQSCCDEDDKPPDVSASGANLPDVPVDGSAPTSGVDGTSKADGVATADGWQVVVRSAECAGTLPGVWVKAATWIVDAEQGMSGQAEPSQRLCVAPDVVPASLNPQPPVPPPRCRAA